MIMHRPTPTYGHIQDIRLMNTMIVYVFVCVNEIEHLVVFLYVSISVATAPTPILLLEDPLS